MADNPYNFYPDAGSLSDTDIWLISRAPHNGNTTLKTNPVSIKNYLNTSFSKAVIIDTQANILSTPSPMIGQLGASTDTQQLLFFNGSTWQISA